MKKVFYISCGFAASILFIVSMNKMMVMRIMALPESYAGAYMIEAVILNGFFAPLFVLASVCIAAMFCDSYHRAWSKKLLRKIIDKVTILTIKFRCCFFMTIYKVALKLTREEERG